MQALIAEPRTQWEEYERRPEHRDQHVIIWDAYEGAPLAVWRGARLHR